jgi:TBC1 domain family member 2
MVVPGAASQEILRQILVDLPRTQPEMPLFHQDVVQRSMERILYVWAIRHPASGYVQGMNDLITPLLLVFLAEHVGDPVEGADVSRLSEAVLQQVEADVYWCMTKLLDNIQVCGRAPKLLPRLCGTGACGREEGCLSPAVFSTCRQDHYTFSQPGLQVLIHRLAELVERHDAALHHHLEAEGIQYVQFAFRWMNCLLMREVSLAGIIRIWDTELSEENGFKVFHVYLCAAFLFRFSEQLRKLQFQELVLFLQDPPTHDWALNDIEPLLSQAHVLRSLYSESPNHLSR